MINLQKTLNFLFVSKVRIKCLKYFFFHQDIPIHLREVARELKEEINAVRRELLRLTEIKLLKVDTRGNRKYFSLNPDSCFFEELNSLIFKSYGLGGDIIKNQTSLGNITYAALSYSCVSGVRMDKNDIDVIIIGEVDMNVLSEIIHGFEEKTERELNYTVLKLGEFELRKKRRDPFIVNMLLATQVMLIGNRGEYAS